MGSFQPSSIFITLAGHQFGQSGHCGRPDVGHTIIQTDLRLGKPTIFNSWVMLDDPSLR